MTDKMQQGLWVTDAELIRRSGVPAKVMRQRIKFYDAHPQHGFPRKNAMFANRRYWPAVEQFFERNAGMNVPERDGRATIAPIRSKAHAPA